MRLAATPTPCGGRVDERDTRRRGPKKAPTATKDSARPVTQRRPTRATMEDENTARRSRRSPPEPAPEWRPRRHSPPISELAQHQPSGLAEGAAEAEKTAGDRRPAGWRPELLRRGPALHDAQAMPVTVSTIPTRLAKR